MAEATDKLEANRPPPPAPVIKVALGMWSQAREQHLIPITGRSMLPLIHDGDRVLVAHGSAGVRRGDVIVFQRQGRLIAHRVLRVDDRPSGRIFLTKGDNTRRFDSPVSADEVVGRVLAVERGGRHKSLDTSTWRVVGWLIVLGTLGWTKLYTWGQGIKRKLLGPGPSRLATFLRWCARAFSALACRVFQTLLLWLFRFTCTAGSTELCRSRSRKCEHRDSQRRHRDSQRAVKRPEVELLLRCARTSIKPASAERIKALLQKDVEWDYLIQTAHRHGVMPLLYHSLHTACPEAVPPVIMDQLRSRFQTNALRNHFLTQELLKLLNLFEAHGIPALPLKGPALAAAAYRDLALRQFGDLDILVHRRDVPQARDLLISQGYRSPSQLTHSQETGSLQIRYHRPFVRDDDRVLVELHWGLMDWQFPFPLDPERLWDHLAPVSLAGATTRSLSPEDLLLFLCAHGSKPSHRWMRLGWICDVAELIHAHQELDWEWVMVQAGELGSERRLLLGLCLAGDILDTTLPKRVRSRIQADPVVESLALQVRKCLFHEAGGRPGDQQESLFDLKVMERWQDRVRSRLRCALTSTIKWALRPPIGLLPWPYRLLDHVPTRNVWLWPLPLFAFCSYLYHLLLPIRRVAKAGLSRLGQARQS